MTEPQNIAADLKQRMDFALDAARGAGRIIMEYYQASGVHVDRKGDSSPVTIADRRAETLIREGIGKNFGEDGILGEEFGEDAGSSGFRWILDPLDGTKAFIHGVPLFGTLIGVEFQGQVKLGVCHFPVLNETMYAARGGGAWWIRGNLPPLQMHVSDVSDFSQALFCFTTVSGFSRIDRQDVFDRLMQGAGLARGWGDCYGHMLVASGRAEVMVDAGMNPWDAAALLPIVEEAGGCFFDWRGETTIYGGNGISVNPALREHVMNIVRV